MSKALIIKGVDFSQDKIKTITLVTVKVCTGIRFEEDSFEITDGGSVTIEYFVTPVDTTDEVIWASSDTNIATVNNGVVTTAGIGECSITATCGEYAASATVTIEKVIYIPNWVLGMATMRNNYSDIDMTTSAIRISTLGSGVQETQFLMARVGKGAVKLPKNTARVKISITNKNVFENGNHSKLIWAVDELAPSSANYIHALSAESEYNIYSETEKTYTVPNGADSMAFTTRLRSNPTSGADINAIAENAGLKIEFLPAIS